MPQKKTNEKKEKNKNSERMAILAILFLAKWVGLTLPPPKGGGQ